MAINLKKGQSIVLDKSEYDLSSILIGLGWDVAKQKTSFGRPAKFDLDAYAILLDESGNLKSVNDVIYYARLQSQDTTVIHSGDNLTGEGEGDDEQIIVRLNSLSVKYQRIVFGVTIYEAKARKQHFGLVENGFVRAIDAKGKEIARYSLSSDTSYDGKASMLMGEVYKNRGEWKFRALGNPINGDLQDVANSFLG